MPRDFGSFEIDYQKFIFKHAYYDKSMQYGSEDPGDPKKTTRVLTFMIADEYLGRRLPLEVWSSICQSLNSEPPSSAPLCASPTRRARIQYLASWLAGSLGAWWMP
jgi:Protein of unknown function (DUF3768)